MTTEEKAKAYDGALERAKKAYNAIPPESRGARKIIEDAFPELRESEDERIRKELISQVEKSKHHPADKARWIAYLEKQKELPFVKDVMLGYPGHYYYDGERMHFRGSPAMEEKQKEQKPNIEICLHSIKSKSYKETGYPSVTRFVYNKSDEKFIRDCANILKANDYEQSAERLLSMIEQKPAEWSDTNELVFQDICKHLKEEGYGGWVVLLEALKSGEFSNHNAEWSEEDEKRLDAVIELLENTSAIHPNYSHRKLIIWLKSLRPQPHWKPSEEQMKALEECGECKRCIKELCEQLKNL